MGVLLKSIFAGSLLGAFLLLGCESSTDPVASTSVVGKWTGKVADSTMALVLQSDASFSATLPDAYGIYTLSGTYKSAGTTLSLKYVTSLRGSPGYATEPSPVPQPDSVTATVSGNKMTIPVPYDQNGAMVTLSKQ